MEKSELKEALEEKSSEIDDVKITDYAYEKARTYARNIKPALGSDYECYFFMVTKKEANDRVVRDIYFPEQSVSHAGVGVTTDSIIQANKEIIKQNKKILGWAHSHGSFEPFHSSTDDSNMNTIINELAADNYVELPSQKEMFDTTATTEVKGKEIVVYDKTKNIKLIVSFDKNPIKAKVVHTKIDGPIRTGFAYSLVVNAKGSPPHCVIAIKEFCPLYLREKEVETFKAKLTLVKETTKMLKLDNAAIIKEIKEKVKTTGFSYFDEEVSSIPLKESYSAEEVNEIIKKDREAIEAKITATIDEFGLKGFYMKLFRKIMKFLRGGWDYSEPRNKLGENSRWNNDGKIQQAGENKRLEPREADKRKSSGDRRG